MGTTSAPGTSLAPSPCPGTQGWARPPQLNLTQFKSTHFTHYLSPRVRHYDMLWGYKLNETDINSCPQGTYNLVGERGIKQLLNEDCDGTLQRGSAQRRGADQGYESGKLP